MEGLLQLTRNEFLKVSVVEIIPGTNQLLFLLKELLQLRSEESTIGFNGRTEEERKCWKTTWC